MVTEEKSIKKRGRPPILSDEHYSFLKSLWADRITTRRGILNKFYEGEALGVILKMQKDEGVTGQESGMIRHGMKWCVGCQQLKTLERFSKDRCQSDGLQTWCKLCQAEYARDYQPKYYREHKDIILPRNRITAREAHGRRRVKKLIALLSQQGIL